MTCLWVGTVDGQFRVMHQRRPDEAILGRAVESHEGVAKCAAALSGRKQAYSREGRRRSAQVPRKRGWDKTHVIVLGANPVRFI